jgi:hypothetical protein
MGFSISIFPAFGVFRLSNNFQALLSVHLRADTPYIYTQQHTQNAPPVKAQ